MKNVRLLIVDDNPQILRFLGNFLSDDFCIVGTVRDEKALIAATVALHPHIIITDIPTMTGLDAVRQVETLMPDSKVIILTDHEEPECAAGASAFLSKKGVPDLCGKIRAIIRDLLAACPKQFTEKARAYGNDHASIERGAA